MKWVIFGWMGVVSSLSMVTMPLVGSEDVSSIQLSKIVGGAGWCENEVPANSGCNQCLANGNGGWVKCMANPQGYVCFPSRTGTTPMPYCSDIDVPCGGMANDYATANCNGMPMHNYACLRIYSDDAVTGSAPGTCP